jgi:tetratricopeptide (TPR) repeat protein
MENRYKEAIETLNILLRADESAYEAYFLRGIAKYNLEDMLGAEADFTLAIEKNPVFTTAYQFRAITRSQLGNYDDALKDFQEAIDLRPDRSDAYFSRGVTYLLTQQFRKAIDDFDMFIRFNDKVADAYLNRGQAYLYLKDTTAAYENYDRAVRTNREYPRGYVQRGSLYMDERKYDLALADFDKAIGHDSTSIIAYFNRAIAYNSTNRPMLALADLDTVLKIDPASSITYFNRALIRTDIGDYNRAMEDYDMVAAYSPDNVIVYYNRAGLHYRLGDFESALADYDKAVELYPDFANAYLNRASVKYLLKDEKGSERDRATAERKIAEYKSKLSDSTFSIYADTSRKFNRLLSFDTKLSGSAFSKISTEEGGNISLRPLYKFTLLKPAPDRPAVVRGNDMGRVDEFTAGLGDGLLTLSNRESDLSADTLLIIDNALADKLQRNSSKWELLFRRGITQSLIKQYTGAVATYSAAIEANPANPFLYLNRSTTQAEMIDFISSIDGGYNAISLDSDPTPRLRTNFSRTYNYDEAIADLNKAAKLYPELPHIYYNRANLLVLSGKLPEAFGDYTRAIELDPALADAWFNRGLIQIYMKDTRKGLLDVSKAGELGVTEAYAVLKRYSGEI